MEIEDFEIMIWR